MRRKTNKMEEDTNVHDIYIIDPVEYLSFVDHFIKVTLKNGESITGTVYTIDPVSQSVILVAREEREETCLKIILKHSIASMEKLNEFPEDQKIINIDIFKNNENCSLNENMKKDVKDWLLKNMIPVIESGDVLQVDTLKIYPPYGVEQCYCDNSIVLSRIQHLLAQIPLKNV